MSISCLILEKVICFLNKRNGGTMVDWEIESLLLVFKTGLISKHKYLAPRHEHSCSGKYFYPKFFILFRSESTTLVVPFESLRTLKGLAYRNRFQS